MPEEPTAPSPRGSDAPSPAADSRAESAGVSPTLDSAESFADLLAGAGGESLVGRMLGRYRLIRRLGQGGMGAVYLAEETDLGRQVALKFILGGEFAGPEQSERLLREARAGAKLRHPGIVPVYHVGRLGARPYLAMGYVEGRTLAEVLEGDPAPSPAEILTWMRGIAEAVHHAHEAGIIHRDLKPGNVIIDGAGRPNVLDFGLARELNSVEASRLTGSGQILGTPEYMSPEQAGIGGARAADRRSDVFSLGVILYHAWSGVSPFRAETLLATLGNVIDREPAPPSTVRARAGRTLPAGIDARDLDTLCLRALEKDPALRYPTALEFGEDLRRCQEGEPVRARSVTSSQRMMRKMRRQRPLVAGVLTGIIGLALLAGLGWRLRARSMEAAAAAEREQAARREADAVRAREEATRARAAALEPYVERARKDLSYLKAYKDQVPPDVVLRKLADAQEAMDQAREIDPESPAVLLVEGQILARQGRYEEAEERYRRAMAADPEAIDPILHVADMMLHRVLSAEGGDDSSAADRAAWCAELAQIGGNDRLRYARPAEAAVLRTLAEAGGRLGPEVLPGLERAIEDDPQFHVALTLIAHVLHREKRYPEALARAEQAAQVNPHQAHPWFLLADSLRALGRYGDMIDPLTRALERVPDDPDLLFLRAVAWARTQRAAEAVRDLDRALRKRPDWLEALANRALARRETGDAAGYAADARRLLELQPGHRVGIEQQAWDRLGAGDLDGAVGLLRELRAREPLGASASLCLAYALGGLDRTDEAVAVLEEAAVRNPQDAWVAINLRYTRGIAFAEQGRYAEARELLTAVAEDPRSGDLGARARTVIARIQEQEGGK